MGIDAKEKTALGASVGADAGQSIQKESDNMTGCAGPMGRSKWPKRWPLSSSKNRRKKSRNAVKSGGMIGMSGNPV